MTHKEAFTKALGSLVKSLKKDYPELTEGQFRKVFVPFMMSVLNEPDKHPDGEQILKELHNRLKAETVN